MDAKKNFQAQPFDENLSIKLQAMTPHVRLIAQSINPWFKAQRKNTYSGIQVNMMSYIARSLNFTYEILINNGGSGNKLDNGTWTGFIGKIMNNVNLFIYHGYFSNIDIYINRRQT